VECRAHLPSILAVAGPPLATVAPPRQKNATAEPVFSPSLSTRSSGELSPPPPCPAGSLTVVGARPPPFAPPPPLWRHRRPRRDAHLGAVTAPTCAALRHTVAGRALRTRVVRPVWPWAAHALYTWAELMLRAWAKHHCATGPSANSAQWHSN
jgi:hypothetical protein